MEKTKLEARRKARTEAKELSVIEAEKNQREVKSITIAIEWRRSRIWGNCPNASAEVHFKDGTFERKNGYRAGGCGYDKESTVIAEIFNDFLSYKLYQKHHWEDSINGDKTNHPYGVYYYGGEVGKKHDDGYVSKPSFNGGVGTSCYYKIAKFIGGNFENVASGNSFDCFKYTDK